MRLANHISFLLAAVLVIPAGLLASQQPCQTSGPGALSNTGDSLSETTRLLSDVSARSFWVMDESDMPVIHSRYGDIDWASVSDNLVAIRHEVNAMGKDLSRLQELRAAALPWQQHEIDRITPRLQDLAAKAEAAIETVRSNEHSLWATSFPDDMTAVYEDAARIRRSVVREIQEAKSQQQLGPTSASGS